jgi:methylmalonyl-CoA mutase cobalamin-binding subunit
MVTEVVVDVLLELRREHQRARGHGYEIGSPEAGGVDRPLAVVGSVEGNRHFLGALCIRLLLERRGWDVLYLGPDVPVEDFAAIQKRRGAGLVCVSLNPPATAGEISRILRVLSEFYDPAVPYALGMGGVLPAEFDRSRLAAGPFRAVDLFASCRELQASLERDREPTEMVEVAS